MLDDAARRLGVCVTAERLEACAELAEWLAPAGARLGLTKFEGPVEFAANLMTPALDLLPHIPCPLDMVAEVGPGNGSLGLTLALLLPDCRILLLDRRKRVCDFLTLAATRFSISNCEAHQFDFEKRTARCCLKDLVTARAVTSADVLLAHLPRLVRSGGRIALFQSETDVRFPEILREVAHEPTSAEGLWLDVYEKTV